MSHKTTLFCFIVPLISLSHKVNAKNFHDYLIAQHWKPVVNLTVGESYARQIAHPQALSIGGNDKIYHFTPYRQVGAQLLLGAYAAFEHAIDDRKSLQLGLSYFQPFSYKIEGDVTSTHFRHVASYRYHITLQQLLAEGKFIYKLKQYRPYLAAGVGEGWSGASNFSSKFPTKLSFQSHIKSNLSYSFETGIDLQCHFWVCPGIGYRLISFGDYVTQPGKTKLSKGPGKLSSQHLYANAIVVHLLFT